MTNGERRVQHSLGPRSTTAPDAFLWWPEPVLHGKRSAERKPDLVVLSQVFGLLVLEVKDWSVKVVVRAGRERWLVRKDGVEREETAPIHQARQASFVLREMLEENPRTRQASGPFQGKPVLPVQYGAVLPNIYREEVRRPGLLSVTEGELYLFAEDLSDASPGSLRALLESQVEPRYKVPVLTAELLQVLGDLMGTDREVSSVPDLRSKGEMAEIEKLDESQRSKARAMGDGHRVLTGCAGSGKTLVLAARARFLKETHPDWRVQVVCFNGELVPHLEKLIGDSGPEPRIKVQTFHGFAREYLTGELAPQRPNEDYGDYARRTAFEFAAKVTTSSPPGGAFDALLIDEGQDLEAKWTNALIDLVNPATESVLFCASRQQNIYGITTYKELGLKARGRTEHLKRSYRCSKEILSLAEAFQPDVVKRKPDAEQPQSSLFPVSAHGGRSLPQIVVCPGVDAVSRYILERVVHYREAELCSLQDIAILYTSKYLRVLGPVAAALEQKFGVDSLFCQWKAGSGPILPSNTLKMLTVHRSKGLEWRVVFVLGLEEIPRQKVDPVRERSLAYVAITRAQDELHLLALRNTGYQAELKVLQSGLTSAPASLEASPR